MLFASFLLLTTILMVVFTLELTAVRRRGREVARIVTVLRCSSCGYSSTRDHQVGDFVGKRESICPRCGGPLVVSAIYEERRGSGERRGSRGSE
jgi:predicted Zn-ribbon and HTH transcriptional regulator